MLGFLTIELLCLIQCIFEEKIIIDAQLYNDKIRCGIHVDTVAMLEVL